MSEAVELSRRDAIGVITIDNPPVNALGLEVRKGLERCMAEVAKDYGIKAAVLHGKGRMFVAGADIREFGKAPVPPFLPDVLDLLERCEKPLVAAVHGNALGGGLEVAIACHYRIALDSSSFGFPEVKLGILPGAGGTQRAPRLIGVEAALELIVNGDPIRAERAKQLGLIDEVVKGDAASLLDDAIAFARTKVDALPPPRTGERTDRIEQAKGRPEIFTDFEKKIAAKKRGFIAPFKCIESVRNAVEMPFEQGSNREREIFVELVASEQAAAQRHVFFSEREVAKIPDVPKDTEKLPVKSAAVIGAGTMGGGIAICLADAGIPVLISDREQQFLDRCMANIQKIYASSVKKGRFDQAEMDRRLALITPTLKQDDLAGVDLVIEAVFEEMQLKKEIFSGLDKTCKPGAILATNTSTLDVDEIAAATSRPEQVIGLHFFSPANLMRLLEIVRGEKTSKQVIATSMDLAKKIRKIGVLVGVCPGFVGNRILYQYRRESFFLVEEGASPQQVDRVIKQFGLPMGPFAMGDLAGLDIGWRVRKAQGKPEGERYAATVADRLCEMGRFGQKTGRGFYRYEEGSRKPIPDPEVDELILQVAKEQGIERREVGDQEILERCIFPMINEGAKILEEGIALRASDIDIIWINGYGFPAYRGGPMFYGQTVGLKKVYDRINAFREQHGKIWEPAPLLKRVAEEGKSFADAAAGG